MRLAGHLGLVLAGLFIAIYPFTIGAAPGLMCREQVLRPGQVCAKADGSSTQSYESRAAAATAATPVLVVLGIVVAGFGGYLVWSDARSRSGPARSKTHSP